MGYAPKVLGVLSTYLFLLRLASSQKKVEYRISEEMPRGTIIGNIVMDASLNKQYDNAILQTLTYSFLSKNGLHLSYLTLKARSGLLTTKERIDRERICPGRRRCILTADIAVSPVRYFQSIQIMVHVLDVNDHAPVFPRKEINLKIPEGKNQGIITVIQAATDEDSGAYGLQRYQLSPQLNDVFLIEMLDTKDVQLILHGRLDRETVPSYSLKIFALDGGQPPKTGSVVINIDVQDENDNNPKFMNSSYTGYVFENATAQTTILRVQAIDPDQGPNGRVIFNFAGSTKAAYGDLFAINYLTGDIYIRGKVDYLRGPILHLVVTAKDMGPLSVPVNTKVTIVIVDINDHPPDITVNTLNGTDTVHISENSEKGTFIAQINVEDKDAGRNGQVRCRIDDRNFEAIATAPLTYKVTTLKPLDREFRANYYVTFTCTDRGEQSLSSKRQIKVILDDENDNAPQFLRKTYNVVLRENNHEGVFIIQVNATDADSGKYAEVHYQVDPHYSRMVAVESNTGKLTAKMRFDRETAHKLEIPVIAMDKGSPVMSATTTVELNIEDENDCDPVFTQSSYAFGIYENLPVPTEVGRVFATDADATPNNKFAFSILSKNTHTMNPFSIDPETGKIITKRILDRENTTSYHFGVMVTDPTETWRRSFANVSVYVADKNDNEPIIRFPNRENNTIVVSSSYPAGYTVARVEAEDKDSGSNAWIKFSIENSDGIFNIEENTGTILVNGDLQNYNGQTLKLVIVVKDSGEPSNKVKAELIIMVNDTLGLYEELKSSLRDKSNDILFLALSGALVVMLVVLTIVLVLIIKRQCKRTKRRQGYISGNLVRVTRPQVDDMRKYGNMYCSEYNTDNQSIQLQMAEPQADQHKSNLAEAGSDDQQYKQNTPDQRGRRIAKGCRESASPAHRSRSHSADILYSKVYDMSSAATTERSRRQSNKHPSAADDEDSDSACSADVSNIESMNEYSEEGSSSTLKPSDVEYPAERRKFPKRGSRDRARRSTQDFRHHGCHNHTHHVPKGRRHGRPDGSSNTDESRSDSSKHKIALVHPQRKTAVPFEENSSGQSSPTDSCQGSCCSVHDTTDIHRLNIEPSCQDVRSITRSESDHMLDTAGRQGAIFKPITRSRMSSSTRPKARIGDDSDDNSSTSGSFVDESDTINRRGQSRSILV